MSELDPASIHRILVALDASPHSLAALDAAVALAAAASAELLALYVEDINLVRMAEFPFAHAVESSTAASRRLDPGEVQRQLRLQAEAARRAVETCAAREHVKWSFRVTRGAVTTEVTAAAAGADVTTLGKTGWAVRGQHGSGSTVRSVVGRAKRPVLVLRGGLSLSGPLFVLYDGSPAARSCLATAARFTDAAGRAKSTSGLRRVVVLLVGSSPAAVEALADEARGVLEGRETTFRAAARVDVETLRRAVENERPGLVVLSNANEPVKAIGVEKLLDAFDAPLLFLP